MTELLEKVWTKVAALPPAEQNVIAEWLGAEREDDARWDATFAQSEGVLVQLADEALLEYRWAGTHRRTMLA